ncbi:MAG: recombinase family protein [Gaiellaceae bacterium]
MLRPTDEDKQPTSLHSQRERLEAFCNAQEEWRIVAHEQDQASGTKLDRPGLQRALAHAREGRIARPPARQPRLCARAPLAQRPSALLGAVVAAASSP